MHWKIIFQLHKMTHKFKIASYDACYTPSCLKGQITHYAINTIAGKTI